MTVLAWHVLSVVSEAQEVMLLPGCFGKFSPQTLSSPSCVTA